MKLAVLLALVPLAAMAAPLLTGVVDTVGGTTFDNQNSSPAMQFVAHDPANGIHVSWLYSTEPYGSTWPDRNVRYNYYDRTTGAWAWIDPDFMLSGTNTQTMRVGYGTMEIDPVSGGATVACHYSAGGMPPTFIPMVARDIAPGGGIYEYCDGAPTLEAYFLPVVATSPSGVVCMLIIKFGVSDNIFFTRSTTWCTWGEPTGWIQSGGYGHNLCASDESEKLVATWMTGNNTEMTLHYRLSPDAGATWDPVVNVVPPSVFGGDTATVCALGASLVFTRNDEPLLVTTLVPLVGDSAYANPAEIWMYELSSATWSRIHRAESHNLSGEFGPNAAICCRPSIGENPDNGRLYVAWEEFDSLNVEPSTNRLRADIYVTSSDDGLFWSTPAILVPRDETSKRFSMVSRNCAGDSMAIFYEQDVIAGFNSDNVGAVSNNPICVWRGSGVGIAERNDMAELPGNPDRVPSVGRMFTFRSAAPRIDIFDASGRAVRQLTSSSTVTWDGRDYRGQPVQPGCYFARLQGPRDMTGSGDMTRFGPPNRDRVPRTAKLVLLP